VPAPINNIFLLDMRKSVPEEYETPLIHKPSISPGVFNLLTVFVFQWLVIFNAQYFKDSSLLGTRGERTQVCINLSLVISF
jgi:hypothetical protein